jgi:hypothetical protein
MFLIGSPGFMHIQLQFFFAAIIFRPNAKCIGTASEQMIVSRKFGFLF